METERKTLGQLFVPICFETLFYMLAGMIDTLMLSSVSDQAVGAVGTATTYVGMFIIMFSIISSGMIAVMTQSIGAGKPGVAYQAKQIGILFNAVLGILLGLFFLIFSGNILEVVGIAEALKEPAMTYLRIVGGSCVFHALIPIFSGYMRSFGFVKQSLYATIIANILNFVLNALFLFGFHMGVTGVAIATVISKVVNFLIVVVESRLLVHAEKDSAREPNKVVLKEIIRIGLPSAMETALYNVAMAFVIRFLNQMDADGVNVTARSYASQITNFSYSIGAALAQANAIMTGWRVGAKEYEECDRGTKRAAVLGIVVTVFTASVIALSGSQIVGLLSDDFTIIGLVGKLLIIDIVLEIGRVTNLVFGQALKTSGDAVFPVIIAAVFMYLCAVGGTYIFGICLNLQVVGAFIGLAMDECVRAIFMFGRWQTGKWRN